MESSLRFPAKVCETGSLTSPEALGFSLPPQKLDSRHMPPHLALYMGPRVRTWVF